MINTVLLRPRNLLVIAALSIVAHLVAMPIYKLVDNDSNTGEN